VTEACTSFNPLPSPPLKGEGAGGIEAALRRASPFRCGILPDAMLRYARYAAAAVFALLSLASIALWIRSHHRQDSAYGPIGNTRYLAAQSECGGLSFEFFHLGKSSTLRPTWTLPAQSGWQLRSVILTTLDKQDSWPTGSVLRGWGFHFERYAQVDSGGAWLKFPHWLLAALFFLLAALFAFKPAWRFSLRGLLIATTFLAALLGLAVYAA
jgi:hypothetical protein